MSHVSKRIFRHNYRKSTKHLERFKLLRSQYRFSIIHTITIGNSESSSYPKFDNNQHYLIMSNHILIFFFPLSVGFRSIIYAFCDSVNYCRELSQPNHVVNIGEKKGKLRRISGTESQMRNGMNENQWRKFESLIVLISLKLKCGMWNVECGTWYGLGHFFH